MNPPTAGPRPSQNCWRISAWRLLRRPTAPRPNDYRRTSWRCFTRKPGPRALRELLKRIHAASFSVRDRLSADTWRILNRLNFDAEPRPGHLPLVLAGSVLNNLVRDLAAFSGMEMENMTRGHGWVFLDLGRRIERGIAVARLLEAALALRREARAAARAPARNRRQRHHLSPALLCRTPPGRCARPAAARSDATRGRSRSNSPSSNATPPASPPAPTRKESRSSSNAWRALPARLEQVRTEAFGAEAGMAATVEWLAGFAVELGSLSELLTQVYFSHVVPRVS